MLESENPSNVLGIEGENHAYLFGKHGYDELLLLYECVFVGLFAVCVFPFRGVAAKPLLFLCLTGTGRDAGKSRLSSSEKEVA